MFPNPNDDPAHSSESLKRLPIASAVPFDLRLPIVAEFVAPLVEPPAVPEVSIDENRDFEAPKRQVGFARKMSDVPLRPPTDSLKQQGHLPFKGGVFPFDGLHRPSALFGGKIVRQRRTPFRIPVTYTADDNHW
jgi:hypothetical protein